jgi:hypothetical protein
MYPQQPNQAQLPPQQPVSAVPVEQAPPVQQQTVPYKQSRVVYLPGATILTDRQDAILEWGADNRIRLYTINTPQPMLIFDCMPQEIQKFSIGPGNATIKLHNGMRYLVEFSAEIVAKLLSSGTASLFGIVGLGAATRMDKEAADIEAGTDIKWWSDTLSRYGVGGIKISAASVYKIDKIGWIIGSVIVGIVFLIVIISIVITAIPH